MPFAQNTTLPSSGSISLNQIHVEAGGATGGELNNAGAEFVGTGGNSAGGNVSIMNEGAKVNTVSANQTHMSEDTGTADKKVQDNLYD